MNLLVDIGNSRVKWALARGTSLSKNGAFARSLLEQERSRLPLRDGVEALFVASVADEHAVAMLEAQARAAGVALYLVRSAARSGRLVNAYARPESLGVDRWMACIAAETGGSGSVLVADAGTALTLDWIDAQGRHGGGLITPGVHSMRVALRRATQLRPAEAHDTDTWLARDTDSAIAAGTRRSALCLLDGAARELKPARLLITGGGADLLAPALQQPWEIAPQLVLEGLAIHAERIAMG